MGRLGNEWHGSRAGRRGSWFAPALVAVAALALLGFGSTPATAKIELRATGLAPGFRAAIRDYTVPCVERTRLVVRAPGTADARIARGEWFERSRERTVQLIEGQAIKVAKRSRGEVVTYSIRCLPTGFPVIDFTRRSEPHYDHYVLAPNGVLVSPYAVIVSAWGVPVWWQSDSAVQDAKVIDGNVVWATDWEGLPFNTSPRAAYEFRDPGSALVRRLQAVGTTTDFHDLQPTDDGNYLLLSYRLRSGVDASAYNGDADATVYDGVVQKVSPDGRLLWEWSTQGHIGLAETGRWWTTLNEPYDIVHINAVEPLPGGDILISLRHTDAVYRVDGATGQVDWKLGGTPIEQSLAVLDDPYADQPLGAQHDVRYLGDGVISIFDNGTDLGRAPRAIRYRIDGGSASLIDELTEPLAPDSRCCGSARYSKGHWLVSWGGEPLVSEFGRNGRRTFKLELGDGAFSYRALGVQGLGRRELRAGMNAQVKPLR